MDQNVLFNSTITALEIESLYSLIDFIRHKALTRWLFPEEIYLMLSLLQVQSMWHDIGRDGINLALSSTPPRQPRSGDLYMFDRRVTVGYRDDGVHWMKKKGTNNSRLQETYQSIKVDGVDVLSGVYSRADANQNFSRRIYRIVDDSDKFALIHYRDCEKRESCPHGRQDQHPSLFYLLDRIRVEYNNLHFFLSGRVFHHTNTVDKNSTHIRNSLNNSAVNSNAIFGVNNNNGFPYIKHSNSNPQLYNMDTNSTSTTYSNPHNVNSETNSTYEIESLNHVPYLIDPAALLQQPPTQYSGNILHESPHFYNPAFLSSPSMSNPLQVSTPLLVSNSMYLSNDNLSVSNSSHYDDSSTPMIDDADIQFLLDATIPSPSVSARIKTENGVPQEVVGQSESRKLPQSIQQQQNQQQQLLLQPQQVESQLKNLSQQQIRSLNITINDFSPSKCADSGGVKMLICLGAQSDICQHATGNTIIYVNFGYNSKVVADVLTSTVLRCLVPAHCAEKVPIWISDSNENILSHCSAECFEFTPSPRPESNHLRSFNLQDTPSQLNNSVYGLGLNKSMQPDNEYGSDADVSSISSCSTTNHKHPRSITPSSSLKGSNVSFTAGTSEKENKIRIVEKLGFMNSSLRSCNVNANSDSAKANAVTSTFGPMLEVVSNKLRSLTNIHFGSSAVPDNQHNDNNNNFNHDNLFNDADNRNGGGAVDATPSPNESFALYPSSSTGKFTSPREHSDKEMLVDSGNYGVNEVDSSVAITEFNSSVANVPGRNRAGSWNTDANVDSVDWLDDNQLSNLTIPELETVMDKYIMTVVKQMVQLAALDDDLKAEIDALDSNGFSLMHYCCLYNLNSLIPVLLARGASVNKKAINGTTPLHLAAASGNYAVTQLLVESGASLQDMDNGKLMPKHAAQLAGHHRIHQYLCAVEALNGSDDEKSLSSRSKKNQPIEAGPVLMKTSADSEKVDNNTAASPHLTRSRSSGALADSSTNDLMDHDISNKLLQHAFTSLSLTDKCALSLTLSQHQLSPHSNAKSNLQSSNLASHVEGNSWFQRSSSSDAFLGDGKSPHREGYDSSCTNSIICNDGDSEADMDVGLGVDFDMQSVLSECDKESLGAAMKLMGESDLQQVEDEVRKIQNNVRGWLLRKNYVNLREAAKVLQVAWREKKKSNPAPLPAASSNSAGLMGLHMLDGGGIITNSNISGGTSQGMVEVQTGSGGAVTFQSSFPQKDERSTPTARARGSFSSIRKQAMASVVIQKSLIKWWNQNKEQPQPVNSFNSNVHQGGDIL